jgi:hypothetical protein
MMASGRTYWAAHSSPEAFVDTAVANTNFVVGFSTHPQVRTSYAPPTGEDLHIVSIGMSVEPTTTKAQGRLEMREGASEGGDVFWTLQLQTAANGNSASEAFSFPEGTFVIPGGQRFCFSVKTGSQSTKIHFVAVGYLQPRTV